MKEYEVTIDQASITVTVEAVNGKEACEMVRQNLSSGEYELEIMDSKRWVEEGVTKVVEPLL